ncbi:MAG TPA: hypothetical protein VF462_03740, partial [Micromonosporaceae bacterium]
MSIDFRTRWRRYATGTALALGGLAAGGILATGAVAYADPTPSASSSASTTTADKPQANRDETKSQRPDETLLSGDTAEKVRAAALAKYPGATIQRVETDSDGVYEAHLVTADGTRVTVE